VPQAVDRADVDSVIDAVSLGAGVEDEVRSELFAECLAQGDKTAERLLVDLCRL